MSTVLALALWGVGTRAWADGELGRSDRAARLYRDPLRMDGRGNPLLPLSVATHVARVEVSSGSPQIGRAHV